MTAEFWGSVVLFVVIAVVVWYYVQHDGEDDE